jgi:protein-S-isoprenylcysteine O-methyltransferase Ste14
MFCMVPLHFLSVERLRLRSRYGEKLGTLLGDALGMVSGWGLFLFWIGVWLSPQPRFVIPVLKSPPVFIPYSKLPIPLLHLAVSVPFLVSGFWLGMRGVLEITLKVAETHRAERVVTTGVYSVVRHPQYLGGLLAHLGISVLLSAWHSLLFTPLVVLLNYLIAWKEEVELVREFGAEYEEYRRTVPMLIPRLRG